MLYLLRDNIVMMDGEEATRLNSAWPEVSS